MSIRTHFENIASAIKQKNLEIVTVTPAQMPQAILDISSGGGLSFIEPLHKNFSGGYVSGGFFNLTQDPCYNDVYLLETYHKYIISLGATLGNRFRCMKSEENTYNASTQIRGISIGTDINDPTFADSVRIFETGSYSYFTIMKTNQGQTNVNTYVIDCTDWS